MTTPDPAADGGGSSSRQQDADRERFRSLLAEVLKSPGDLIEDALAAAVENADRRRDYHEQPPVQGVARRA